MALLGQPAPRLLRRLEIGVGFQVENLQRAHLVGAAAAVARSAPAIMLRTGIAARATGFLGGTVGRLLGAEPREIIPAAIIFGGVGFAEIPAFGAVRRLGRGTVAGLAASVPVAQPHLLRLAPLPIGAPAGKSPVIGSLGAAHPAHVAIAPRHG